MKLQTVKDHNDCHLKSYYFYQKMKVEGLSVELEVLPIHSVCECMCKELMPIKDNHLWRVLSIQRKRRKAEKQFIVEAIKPYKCMVWSQEIPFRLVCSTCVCKLHHGSVAT